MPLLALTLFVGLTPCAEGARQVDGGTMTIRLLSTETYSEVLTDRAPTRQLSKGDVLVVGSTLRNAVAQLGRPKGAVVGEDAVIFTIRSRAEADVIVKSYLLGGWLRGAGRTQLGGKQRYSVTGGGGRFAKARGTGESIPLANRWGSGSHRLKLYRFQLP